MLEPTVNVDLSNKTVDFSSSPENRHKQCIDEIHHILGKGYSPATGNQLIEYLQRQRAILVEVIVENFLQKPNPKMADAVNTLLAQMEKSVRDDRKEALKGKELETSRETFELFSQSLTAVLNGEIKLPTFAHASLELDPLKEENKNDFEFTKGEFITGHHLIDTKDIEKQLEEAKYSSEGSGELN